MADTSLESTLMQFTQELRELLDDQLLAVVLYGSAAGENFVPGSSDLNTAIVVQRMGFAVLKKLQPRMVSWHKRGFAVPLIVDRNFLHHSRDVFPMEYSDIKEQHRTLWGEEISALSQSAENTYAFSPNTRLGVGCCDFKRSTWNAPENRLDYGKSYLTR